jgi:hypothetical protein
MGSASNEERELHVNEKITADRSEFLRQAASIRMESQLLRQAGQDARGRSLITCTRTRLLLERSERTAAKVERGRAQPSIAGDLDAGGLRYGIGLR